MFPREVSILLKISSPGSERSRERFLVYGPRASLTKPGPAGRTGHDDWPVQASVAVLVVACLHPVVASKLPNDVYLALWRACGAG